jgi:hypothetical protein
MFLLAWGMFDMDGENSSSSSSSSSSLVAKKQEGRLLEMDSVAARVVLW